MGARSEKLKRGAKSDGVKLTTATIKAFRVQLLFASLFLVFILRFWVTPRYS